MKDKHRNCYSKKQKSAVLSFLHPPNWEPFLFKVFYSTLDFWPLKSKMNHSEPLDFSLEVKFS